MNPVVASPQLWYRLALVLVSVVGFVTGSHWTAYFTTLTNSVVIGYFAITLYTMWVRRTTDPPAPRLRGGVVTWILIVGIVAHFDLNAGQSPFPGLVDPDPATRLANWSLFFFHYVIPVMVLIDWIAFGPHRVVRWRDLPIWLLYPFAYGLITLLRAMAFPQLPDRFPYSFFQPGAWGWWGVVLDELIAFAAMAAIGAAVIGIDRLVAAIRPDRRRAAA